MKVSDIEKLIQSVYSICYDKEAFKKIDDALENIATFVKGNHFIKSRQYLNEVQEISEESDDLSRFSSTKDKILQENIKRKIANLARKIIDENKKIFIVHGRNIAMRDKLAAFLGKLKLDFVILEQETNKGSTIIEKFLRSSEDCRYAVILLSADDIGALNNKDSNSRPRARQNVILELGFFLGKLGRKNIIVLHEIMDIEKPSDFDGIVYEAFDDFGGWKSKLIREMKQSQIYIDPNLADQT